MQVLKPILAGLALLFATSQVRAEYRTVLIQVKQDKEKKKTTVTIHSDEEKEQKTAISVDEAVKILANMKGWGSSVGVYIAAERLLEREDRKKLLDAVDDNIWLELEYFGREVPKNVADHFLKERDKHEALIQAAVSGSEYVGLTEKEVLDTLGKPTSMEPGVWEYWRLSPGAHSFIPVRVVRFKDGRVISAAVHMKGVGCIIVKERK